MRSVKLTAPQKALLQDVSDGQWHHANQSYPPCKALLAFNFVERKSAKFGGVLIRITDKGREALK